jgi:hypothetical protein
MTAFAMVSSRRNSGAVARVLRSAARGGVLIGIAVVIGIVLLQVVDGGSGGSGGVTTPTGSGGGGTSTTVSGERPPEQVSVYVLNGSGIANAAATKQNDLRALGYLTPGTGNAPLQTGTTVGCQTDFESEAQTLITQLSVSGAAVTLAPFPATVPAGAETSNCIVIVGK